MAKILIYTTKHCPYCKAAKGLLLSRGVLFEEILIQDDDDAGWEKLTASSGMQTVPQIFYDNILIGGFQQLAELDKKDKLNSLKKNR